MTECERFIKTGRFNEDFFKEEVRCDFKVDAARKKIWAVLLDMLMEFDRVCKKYNLKYWMGGGSLLGAIRHKGFIPWDDDIDVNMMREDYDKLMDIGKDEFQSPYFLQTPYTDPGYYFSFAKLRNSRTSAVSYDFRYENFNQGMFIDIFPYDNCVLGDAHERYNKIDELIRDNSTFMRMKDPNPNEENKLRIQNHSGRDPMDVFKEMTSIARKYENENTEYVSNALITASKCEKNIYKKSAFEHFINTEFEILNVPIPEEYDYVLKIHYGDYMELPPADKRGQWHSKTIFDPDCPYDKYIERLR